MTSPLEIDAALVAPPTEHYARTTVTTVEQLQLPATFTGSYLTVAAESVDVYLTFATTQAGLGTIDTSARSTVTASVPAAVVNGCYVLPAGSERHYYLPRHAQSGSPRWWLGHQSASTGGVLRFFRSSRR